MIDKYVDALLIEDNPDDVMLIRELLSDTALTISHFQWAETMEDAGHLLEEVNFDIVLSDLHLPDSRGLKTVENLKILAPGLPIVVLTGMDNKDMGRAAIQEGAQDYICKNDLTVEILERSIRFAIERHQLYMELENKKSRLAENEALFQRIIDKNADGMLLINENGRINLANPAAEEIIGKSSAELRGMLFGHRLLPGGFINLSGAPRQQRGGQSVEMRVKEIEWQNRIAYLATLRDVTEYKELEDSLLIEKERLDITLNSIADGVITADRGGSVSSVNPAAREILGLEDTIDTGGHIERLLNIQCKKCNESTINHGTSAITKNDKPLMIEYSCAPITGKSKERELLGYVFVIRDITIRQKMAEEIIKVQKLEALGTVAGKLAHEYYEVLTLILGNIAIAKKLLPNGDKVMRMLEKAESGTLRARELTNQLHTFSDSSGSTQTNGALAGLVKDIAAALLRDSSITCGWSIEGDLYPLEFDKDQVYTALWNVIKNAREALPQGGNMEIHMENTEAGPEFALPIEEGNYVKISIIDHGHGMDDELLNKIFDPFFTTKERAVGMGLTTAFSIIKKHNGALHAESQPGEGSRFYIFLPAAAKTDGDPGTGERAGGGR